MRLLPAFTVALFLVGPASAVPKPAPPVDSKKDERVNERVRNFFAAMRDGTFREANMPKLGWEDVPSLLEMGGSATKLQRYPTNPISSLAIPEVPEGMMALWLVEGIRIGKRFPSLNPLVLPTGALQGARDKTSAENQARALKAYKDWWDKAAALTREKAAAIDPLKAISLKWY
jgi:hypothetical protein